MYKVCVNFYGRPSQGASSASIFLVTFSPCYLGKTDHQMHKKINISATTSRIAVIRFAKGRYQYSASSQPVTRGVGGNAGFADDYMCDFCESANRR